jgi:hypothetical protein
LKIVDRLKLSEIIDFSFRSASICQRYLNSVGFESVIIKDSPMILNEFGRETWQLLYRGSIDGFKASNFHEKCDNRMNTLTFIETTKTFIFGGFTPISWDSTTGDHKPDNSGKNFLFNLTNARNIAPRKFILMSGNNAIYCNSSYGPYFAGNSDIAVSDNCNTATNNFTNLGGSCG